MKTSRPPSWNVSIEHWNPSCGVISLVMTCCPIWTCWTLRWMSTIAPHIAVSVWHPMKSLPKIKHVSGSDSMPTRYPIKNLPFVLETQFGSARGDKVSRKVSIERSPCRLTLPPHIRKMLGMTMVSSFANNQSKAESVVNMDPVDSLYVYCDVVEPRVEGDKQVILFRIVPAEGDHGQLMTQIYKNVHYVRLQRKSFQTIEIDIRDRPGNIVPFEQGTLNVTLHFCQRKRLSTLWTWKAEACLCILEHPIREAMVSAVSWKTFSVRQLPFSNMQDGRHWKQGSLW